MNTFLYKGFTLFFLCFNVFVSIGQEREEYNGPFQIGTFSGNARYQYILENTDTIFDGSFLFQRSNLETLLKEQDSSFTIKGSFRDSLANGPWQFQFGEYTSDSKSEVVDFEYRILVSGIQEMAKGVLDEGIPDGEWQFTVQDVDNSEVTNTLFKSVFNYERGVPQQNFNIESDSSALVGRFLRNGLAHDEWTSYGSDALNVDEVWVFEEGRLQKIVFESTGEEVLVFNNDNQQYGTIPLGNRFLLLLKYNLQEKFEQSSIITLLSKNREQYQKVNSILIGLGSRPFSTSIQVKVPIYPIDSLKENSLERIASNVKKASEISETILTNSHLNMVRRTDADAQFWYAITEKIQMDYLNALKKYVELYQNQIFEFVNPTSLQGRFFSGGKPSKTIQLSENQDEGPSSFQLPDAEDYEFNGNNLKSVGDISAYAKDLLDYAESQLADKLSDDEQIQSLKELENDLIAINSLIEKQIDSLTPNLPENYTNALENLGNSANQKLATYAAMANPNEKLTFGENLKSCLEDTKSLVTNISSMPSKITEIKALYTDDIWNPFMATVMEEEVKKRIVEAYTDILVPYFVNSISEDYECEQIAEWKDQIIYTNNRMVDLRDEDTRKLERKLKRAKNAESVLKLLHQFPNSKEE